MNRNSVKILSGELKGRNINFLEIEGLRPTPSRIRQTVFNWLRMEIYNQTCLDLFAGSGALGIESISNGAREVTFIEKNTDMAKLLKENIKQAKISPTKARVINSNYKNFINLEIKANKKYDIIFLDPPYSLGITKEIIESSKQLSPKFIYIESDKPLEELLLEEDSYELYKCKKAGLVYFGLLKLKLDT